MFMIYFPHWIDLWCYIMRSFKEIVFLMNFYNFHTSNFLLKQNTRCLKESKALVLGLWTLQAIYWFIDSIFWFNIDVTFHSWFLYQRFFSLESNRGKLAFVNDYDSWHLSFYTDPVSHFSTDTPKYKLRLSSTFWKSLNRPSTLTADIWAAEAECAGLSTI